MNNKACSMSYCLRVLHCNAGTGIAPFRSFWRRIFYDGIDGQPSQPFSDNAMFWLLSGFANTDRWESSFLHWTLCRMRPCCLWCLLWLLASFANTRSAGFPGFCMGAVSSTLS
jgi:hypothetical protein